MKWLIEKFGYDVVALTLDVGRRELNLDLVAEKARNLGAVDTITMDVKNEFVNDYISKSILPNGMYESAYPLSTSIARPMMAEKAVAVSQEFGCTAVTHGCTGKGNDQVRFETSIKSLDSAMDVIAPVREWNMNRDDEIEYARKHGIPIPLGGKYSVDENMWGRSVEGSSIEDPSAEIPEDAYYYVTLPTKSSDAPVDIKIKFENGIPVELGGGEMPLQEIIHTLTTIAGSSGYGAIDHIENRVTGIKSGEFYECPAALSIFEAKKKLTVDALLNVERLIMSMTDLFSKLVFNAEKSRTVTSNSSYATHYAAGLISGGTEWMDSYRATGEKLKMSGRLPEAEIKPILVIDTAQMERIKKIVLKNMNDVRASRENLLTEALGCLNKNVSS